MEQQIRKSRGLLCNKSGEGENTGKKQIVIIVQKQEYLEDKEKKNYGKKLLVAVDDILGYTCISKG